MNREEIVEKKLKIPGNYQYRALTSGWWPQRNWHNNKFVIVNACLGFSPDERVLDLGTGSGNFELLFGHKVKSVVGVDYHDAALSFLEKKLKEKDIRNVSLVKADIRHLPKTLRAGKYDLIVIIDVIEHLRQAEAFRLLNILKSLLRARGRLLIITPNYTSLWVIWEFVLDVLGLVPKFAEEQHLFRFNKKNLVEMLKISGYKILEASSFNLFSFLVPTKSVGAWLALLERKVIGNSGCLLTVVAQK